MPTMTCTGRRSGTSSLKFKLAASLITMPESWMIAALKLPMEEISRGQFPDDRSYGNARNPYPSSMVFYAVPWSQQPAYVQWLITSFLASLAGTHARRPILLDHSLHLYRVDDHSCTRTVLPQRQTSALAPPSCHQPALDHHLSTTFFSRSLTQHGIGEYHHPHCPDDDAAMTPPLQYHLLTSPTTAYTHGIGEYHHPHTDVDGHPCHQPAL